jgi:predicted DNA-binding transcriptional regulator AlpA
VKRTAERIDLRSTASSVSGLNGSVDRPPHHSAVAALEAFARNIPVDSVPDLIAQIEGLKALLYARLSAPALSPAPLRDRLLNVKEAAQKLCRSSDWLYRHASELPFVIRDGRLLRFSEQGIEGYIKRRTGVDY